MSLTTNTSPSPSTKSAASTMAPAGRSPRALSRRSFVATAGFAALSALGLSACSNDGAGDTPATTGSQAGSAASSPAGSATASGSVLVAYYSASGHTEAVAQTIADELGADLFAITPAEPYTSDDLNYNDAESRVSREHDDESLRDAELETVTPDGFDGYDTVFVGYPIWWGIAAWPTDGFVSGNDFDGKTVIPFCTSASSPIGESGANLAELAGTGNWQEGMRFRSSADETDVRSWVQGLSL